MAWRAMEKAKGVESRVGEGGNRTAESSQEGGANDRGLRDMADTLFPACDECRGAIEELYL